MSQDYSYPSSSTVTVAAIGPNGQPIPNQSILVAGEDPSGDLSPLQTDVSGALIVTIGGGISNPLPTTDAADGPVTPGAVASNSILIGGQFNTVLPTLTNGQQAALQADSSGRLLVNISSGISNPLPVTDAAAEASLASIDAKLPGPLGAHVIAASLAVNIASDQTVPVSVASLPLPSGAATEATLSAFSDKTAGALVPEAFDYIEIAYVGITTDIDTVEYKTGGAGGTLVATLTMGYDGSNRLSSVTRS